MRQKANALNNSGCSDDSVLRILWVGFGELNRTNRYLRSDRENLHIGSTFLHKGIDAHIDIDSLVHCQPCDFPKADRRKSKRPGFAGRQDCLLCFWGKVLGSDQKPDKNRSIKKDHSASQSLAGTVFSISPLILAMPAKAPKISSSPSFAGTSFTTGLPCLVITTGRPLCDT